MPIQENPLAQLYSGWEKFLHTVAGPFKDLELDDLSKKVDEEVKKATKDGNLTPKELDSIYQRIDLVTRAWEQAAKKRGVDPAKATPATETSFSVYGELQEIHFGRFGGKDLRGGLVGDLVQEIRSSAAKDSGQVQKLAKEVAFDLLASRDERIAKDKVHVLRSQLSLLPDRGQQLAALAVVGQALTKASQGWIVSGGRAVAMTPEKFQQLANIDLASQSPRWRTPISVQTVAVPAEFLGNKMFPNRPAATAAERTAFEASSRSAVKAGFDDLAKDGKLFLSKVPVGQTRTVALKLDLNLGADGHPSVTEPNTTQASIVELLERSKTQGKKIRLTVGDSAGGENIPLGRTTIDIMRDTGNYHHALKAAFRFMRDQGTVDEQVAGTIGLSALNKAEGAAAPHYLGSKEWISQFPSRAAAEVELLKLEAMAKDHVVIVDYDDPKRGGGYQSVKPDLGPIGLAAWGSKEFNIAKPWMEADFRVHVTRGSSTHILAGWTGALKGLIGLHAFGLRPVDQGMDKRGDHGLDTLPLLTQAGGFGALLAQRSGVKDLLSRAAEVVDPDVVAARKQSEDLWNRCSTNQNKQAWKIFRTEVDKLTTELKANRKAGMPDPELFEIMRQRVRSIFDRAETEGQAPTFRQDVWDAMHAATRFGMTALRHFRFVIPKETRDEDVGARIGLLSDLPKQSDLVVGSNLKLGEGGGPDAYHAVRDTGFIIVGTDESSVDLMALRHGKQKGHAFAYNFPIQSALRLGQSDSPMHYDEIQDLSGRPLPPAS